MVADSATDGSESGLLAPSWRIIFWIHRAFHPRNPENDWERLHIKMSPWVGSITYNHITHINTTLTTEPTNSNDRLLFLHVPLQCLPSMSIPVTCSQIHQKNMFRGQGCRVQVHQVLWAFWDCLGGRPGVSNFNHPGLVWLGHCGVSVATVGHRGLLGEAITVSSQSPMVMSLRAVEPQSRELSVPQAMVLWSHLCHLLYL